MSLIVPNLFMPFRFDPNHPGWLHESEGTALAALAQGRRVLEIGTWRGKSTFCIAQTAKYVHTVDDYRSDDVLADFWNRVKKARFCDKIVLHVGGSRQVLPRLTGPFDLCFIDGSHLEEDVRFDIEECRRLVFRKNGCIAIHDYISDVDLGPQRAADDLLGQPNKIVHTLALYVYGSRVWEAPSEPCPDHCWITEPK